MKGVPRYASSLGLWRATLRQAPVVSSRLISSRSLLSPSTAAVFASSRPFNRPISSLSSLVRHYSTTNGPAPEGDERRLTVPELTRSLVESRKSGTLTTVQLYTGADQPHHGTLPLFGSLMPYVLDDHAAPIFGLRPDEKHVKNLEHLDMASLVVYPLTPVNINPSNFALPRVNLAGRLRKLDPVNPNDGVTAMRRQYLLAHPGCKKIIDDLDFYKLDIEDTVYCSGGLRETTHVSLDKYKATKPDVVTQDSRFIVEWMNEPKRAIYLKLFCQEYAQVDDVGEIFMFSVDRKGFEVMAWRQTNRNWVEYRFPFPYEMKSVDDCKGGLLDSCAFLHDKYLKEVEGGEKFDVEEERKRERERQLKEQEKEEARRKELAEPEFS